MGGELNSRESNFTGSQFLIETTSPEFEASSRCSAADRRRGNWATARCGQRAHGFGDGFAGPRAGSGIQVTQSTDAEGGRGELKHSRQDVVGPECARANSIPAAELDPQTLAGSLNHLEGGDGTRDDTAPGPLAGPGRLSQSAWTVRGCDGPNRGR